jgi:hypothetical protein
LNRAFSGFDGNNLKVVDVQVEWMVSRQANGGACVSFSIRLGTSLYPPLLDGTDPRASVNPRRSSVRAAVDAVPSVRETLSLNRVCALAPAEDKGWGVRLNMEKRFEKSAAALLRPQQTRW